MDLRPLIDLFHASLSPEESPENVHFRANSVEQNLHGRRFEMFTKIGKTILLPRNTLFFHLLGE